MKFLSIILVFLLCGCGSRGHLTYNDPHLPSYIKSIVPGNDFPGRDGRLKVVSYNIHHSNKIDRVIEIFRTQDSLKDADILCLQEMDLTGIQKLAHELDYGYVYYPAVRHAVTRKDFGNAILSRWPLSEGQKHILPPGRMTQMQRVMVSASAQLAENKISVYCLHDDVYLSAYKKRDLARFVLDNIPDDGRHVIVAGDFNTYSRRAQKSVEKEFERERFQVSAPNVSWTYKHWYLLNKKSKLDHIFSQNMRVVDSGVVSDRSASDHMPVWSQLIFENQKIVLQNQKSPSPEPFVHEKEIDIHSNF